jgi:pyruvate/2-oxoglutarate/acetoin dehydrogenase E1 component
MMTYKEALAGAMRELAADPLVRIIGYGVKFGRAAGTLKGIADESLIETPVAENLMVGLAVGLALKGLRPVVYIERMDFLANAIDAVVNHLDKIDRLSGGEFQPVVLLRVVVGNKQKPLFTGVTHCQDFSEAVRRMVGFPVQTLQTPEEIGPAYRWAHEQMKDLRT